ncbi:hypothetical protein CFAM422_008551 [Trichoderma lentiforme]|uniref:Uncharacterized protein n=1 Tax=Trichoderma lentiforme TaxID=1567552 RepID=A0A9P4XBJ2_9HYPO|nr:hypothetical protein CFAM422_008551 [Trichoderma lentiforme]
MNRRWQKAPWEKSTWFLFDMACKQGLNNPVEKGPSTLHFIHALVEAEGHKEENLPSSWAIFASRHPGHATLLRRDAKYISVKGVGRLDVSAPPAGSDFTTCKISFQDGIDSPLDEHLDEAGRNRSETPGPSEMSLTDGFTASSSEDEAQTPGDTDTESTASSSDSGPFSEGSPFVPADRGLTDDINRPLPPYESRFGHGTLGKLGRGLLYDGKLYMHAEGSAAWHFIHAEIWFYHMPCQYRGIFRLSDKDAIKAIAEEFENQWQFERSNETGEVMESD